MGDFGFQSTVSEVKNFENEEWYSSQRSSAGSASDVSLVDLEWNIQNISGNSAPIRDTNLDATVLDFFDFVEGHVNPDSHENLGKN